MVVLLSSASFLFIPRCSVVLSAYLNFCVLLGFGTGIQAFPVPLFPLVLRPYFMGLVEAVPVFGLAETLALRAQPCVAGKRENSEGKWVQVRRDFEGDESCEVAKLMRRRSAGDKEGAEGLQTRRQ